MSFTTLSLNFFREPIPVVSPSAIKLPAAPTPSKRYCPNPKGSPLGLRIGPVGTGSGLDSFFLGLLITFFVGNSAVGSLGFSGGVTGL